MSEDTSNTQHETESTTDSTETAAIDPAEVAKMKERRDRAVLRAQQMEDRAIKAEQELEAAARQKAEAEGDIKKLLELEQQKREEAEAKVADATGKLTAYEKREHEREFIGSLAAELPGARLEIIRGIYLSLCEDGKLTRHPEDAETALKLAIEEIKRVDSTLADKKKTPKQSISGGARVPAGFHDGGHPHQQTIAEARAEMAAKNKGFVPM